MKALTSTTLFWAAFVIVILTNLIVLGGVYYNKSVKPESEVSLTERELSIPYRVRKENSGVSLRIVWQSLGKNNRVNQQSYQTPQWLTEEKLRLLGFGIERIKKDEREYRYDTSKECYIVLEYDGESYQEALQRAQSDLDEKKEAFDSSPQNKQLKSYYTIATNVLKNRKEFESRLYAIDVADNALTLREKYPDRSKYIIAKALIHITYNALKKELYGTISNLTISRIHVPLTFRKTLEPIIQQKMHDMKVQRTYYSIMKHPPRFKATIAYGKKLEPWVVSIEPLDTEGSAP